MELSEATTLTKTADVDSSIPEVWLDLGCGAGLFTMALASLLSRGSKVIGVEIEEQEFSVVGTDKVVTNLFSQI